MGGYEEGMTVAKAQFLLDLNAKDKGSSGRLLARMFKKKTFNISKEDLDITEVTYTSTLSLQHSHFITLTSTRSLHHSHFNTFTSTLAL